MPREGLSTAPQRRRHLLMTFKVRVIRLIPPIDFENSIIGQYGRSSDGEKPGYKDDDTVPKESRCATLCATVAYIKSGRWDGVPFILKAGKGCC